MYLSFDVTLNGPWQWRSDFNVCCHDISAVFSFYRFFPIHLDACAMDCWVHGWEKLSKVHQLGQTSDRMKSLSQKQTEVIHFQREVVIWGNMRDSSRSDRLLTSTVIIQKSFHYADLVLIFNNDSHYYECWKQFLLSNIFVETDTFCSRKKSR